MKKFVVVKINDDTFLTRDFKYLGYIKDKRPVEKLYEGGTSRECFSWMKRNCKREKLIDIPEGE